MPFKSQKLKDSANGQECTFQIPGVCNHDNSTVVLCHLPTKTNSGMAMKPPDYIAAFGCHACHWHFDHHKLDPIVEEQTARRAHARTLKKWLEMGLMTFPETKKQKQASLDDLKRKQLFRSK